MQDKIQLYEELLEMEPGSRLFLPLARLYLEQGDTDKAEATLQSGLGKHPEHFEARLLLHQILYEQDRREKAREHLQMVTEVLWKYPAFWEQWAESMQEEGQAEPAVAVAFLARAFRGLDPRWSDVLREGILTLGGSSHGAASGSGGNSEVDPGAESPAQVDAGPETGTIQETSDPYRTKTMADIVCSQGDYAQALDIYTELRDKASTEAQRQELQENIDWVQEKLGQASASEEEAVAIPRRQGDQSELIHRLQSLADRLEARRAQ